MAQVWGTGHGHGRERLAPALSSRSMRRWRARRIAVRQGRASRRAHITQFSPSQFLSFLRDCGEELQNGEQVLAFFFDLAACIQEDSKPVELPPIVEPR